MWATILKTMDGLHNFIFNTSAASLTYVTPFISLKQSFARIFYYKKFRKINCIQNNLIVNPKYLQEQTIQLMQFIVVR